MLDFRYSPLYHNVNKKLHRVPVYKNDDECLVYVADNFTRMYCNDTLPDEIKIKLTMVTAVNSNIMSDRELNDYPLKLYHREYFCNDDSLDEIGWRVSDHYYCLCLSNKLLGEMGSY
jgi:hypothetical protein